jgi:hypothetical protein
MKAKECSLFLRLFRIESREMKNGEPRILAYLAASALLVWYFTCLGEMVALVSKWEVTLVL